MLKDWTNLMSECDKKKFNEEIVKMIKNDKNTSNF